MTLKRRIVEALRDVDPDLADEVESDFDEADLNRAATLAHEERIGGLLSVDKEQRESAAETLDTIAHLIDQGELRDRDGQKLTADRLAALLDGEPAPEDSGLRNAAGQRLPGPAGAQSQTFYLGTGAPGFGDLYAVAPE